MRLARLLASLSFLGIAACHTATSPTVDLTGTWQWQGNQNPSGSEMTLYLQSSGATVTGMGILIGVGPSALPDTAGITGRSSGASFAVHLSDPSGLSIAYSGKLVAEGQLQGTWTRAPDTRGTTVVFYRR